MNRRRIAGAPVLFAAAGLAVIVAVFLDEAGVKKWQTQAAAAVAAAAVTLFGNFIKEWATEVIHKGAKLNEERTRYLFMQDGKVPRVRGLDDPTSIGVHPAPPRSVSHGQMAVRGDRVPVYVQRDIDAELRAALTRSGFVVLVGDATAGKTRTAFEAMRSVLPDHTFIAPSRLEGVPVAVREAVSAGKCVLFLDDLQDFLGPDGLTSRAIANLMFGNDHHRVILATIRATEASRLTTGAAKEGESLRLSQSVIQQAHRIFVERLFNAAEYARAEELAGQDSRLADAVNHATNYGIGEYLACGPQLFAEWEEAWARGNHPRGAALIAAAVDCRRAGFTGPLPQALIEQLHAGYLEHHSGSPLYPETLAEAWTWALQRRESRQRPNANH